MFPLHRDLYVQALEQKADCRAKALLGQIVEASCQSLDYVKPHRKGILETPK